MQPRGRPAAARARGPRGLERVAEIGTGCGVGSAWILSALDPAVPFYTVELDEARAAAAAELLADDPDGNVLHGDWREVLAAEAPFDLLFADGGRAKDDDELVGLLAPGGMLVLDDLTPGYADPDPVRELWLGHPRLVAVELQISPRKRSSSAHFSLAEVLPIGGLDAGRGGFLASVAAATR